MEKNLESLWKRTMYWVTICVKLIILCGTTFFHFFFLTDYFMNSIECARHLEIDEKNNGSTYLKLIKVLYCRWHSTWVFSKGFQMELVLSVQFFFLLLKWIYHICSCIMIIIQFHRISSFCETKVSTGKQWHIKLDCRSLYSSFNKFIGQIN